MVEMKRALWGGCSVTDKKMLVSSMSQDIVTITYNVSYKSVKLFGI